MGIKHYGIIWIIIVSHNGNDDSQHDLKGIIALLLGKMTKSTVETGIIYWIALKQLHATACHVCLEPFATIAIRRTMSLVISVDLCSAAR